ncbi:MAG: hypothetical protein ACI843_000810 [Psychrobacter glaciei]|jgi:hypothetical protein
MSARFKIRRAEQSDSQALLTLINNTPQPGSVSLNFERSPNFFHATEITTSEPEVWLMEDHHEYRLAASFSIGKRYVYVNGEKKLTRYGNDLRIHEDYKGGRTLFRLFKKYRELMQDDWMQTVILEDNKTSINTVGSGRLSLPNYHEAGKLVTHMITLNQKIVPEKHKIRRATSCDVNLIQAFFDENAKKKQFYPCYDFSKINSGNSYYRNLDINNYYLCIENNELVAVAGVWDQKEFKQTRFLSYHGNMRLLRHINNISSKFFGGLNLPAPGSIGNYISMHSILCKDNSPSLLKSLVSKIMMDYKDSSYDALILGFDKKDILHQGVNKLKRHSLVSNHYLVSYGEQPDIINNASSPHLMYLELCRL